jgi:hypothetical protein
MQLNADAALSNELMASSLVTQLDVINPYRLWQAQSYSNVSGSDKHSMKCFDCFSFLHYANAYNVLVSSMTTDSVANRVVLGDQRILNDANSGHDANVLVDDIFDNLCVTGVHVVIRYVDEWMDNDFEERTQFTVGEKKTITVWAEEGFCQKEANPMSQTLFI